MWGSQEKPEKPETGAGQKETSGRIAVKRNKEGTFAELLSWAMQRTFFNGTTEMPLRLELLLITGDCWNPPA